MRKLAAGNWKMNGLRANLNELVRLAETVAPEASCDILICPPSTLISAAVDSASGQIAIGGQDCHAAQSGAHTGDVSAQMLRDAGASAVILGHSERRADHGESNAIVAEKVKAAWAAGLTALVCIGETLAQYEAGETLAALDAQLAASLPDGATGANTVVAYEPVWAIGSGRIPALHEIAATHSHLRDRLTQRFGAQTAAAIRLLYGGSVKPSNARDVFAQAHVDGALVGGASLTAQDFGAIIAALSAS